MVSPRLVLVPIIVQIVHLLQRQETGEDMRWMWVRGGGGWENGGHETREILCVPFLTIHHHYIIDYYGLVVNHHAKMTQESKTKAFNIDNKNEGKDSVPWPEP